MPAARMSKSSVSITRVCWYWWCSDWNELKLASLPLLTLSCCLFKDTPEHTEQRTS